MKLLFKNINKAAVLAILIILFCSVLFLPKFIVSLAIVNWVPRTVQLPINDEMAWLKGDNSENYMGDVRFEANQRDEVFAAFPRTKLEMINGLDNESMIFKWDEQKQWFDVIYFDEGLRLFVKCRIIPTKSSLSKKKYEKEIIAYYGINGICEKTNKDVRFGRLDFCENNLSRFFSSILFCLDEDQKRFYSIGFEEREFIKGSILDDSIGRIEKVGFASKNELYGETDCVPAHKDFEIILKDLLRGYIFVVNSDGEILLLDERLGFDRKIGYLADPPLTGRNRCNDKNLFAYNFKVLTKNDEIVGGVLSGMSGQLYWPFVCTFDGNGNFKESMQAIEPMPSLSGPEDMPWPFAAKYIVENLYPWGFNVLSYAAADVMDLGEQFSAMFILPDSYNAMFGRDNGDAKLLRHFAGMFFIPLLSLVIGMGLAIRAGKEAKRLGVVNGERKCWIVLIIIFGICGYICWNILKPKEVLVTCKNCGKMRLPSDEQCHNCKAGWELGELDRPMWSVISA